MNYFNSDISNSTNTVVYFDGNDGNLYQRLRAMSHTFRGKINPLYPIRFASFVSIILYPMHIDELSSARIWQHEMCATLPANVDIDYRHSHQNILPYSGLKFN
jgi:hypothetical protein